MRLPRVLVSVAVLALVGPPGARAAPAPDASDAAPAPAPADGDRWAVVIGIDAYQDLGRLTTCRADARALARVLIERGGYTPNRVILMTDDAPEPQDRPTLATLRKRIERTARVAGPRDTLLVYFSGHGVVRDGRGYLVPVDGDAQTALALDWVKERLAASKAASKVLILDACHAGAAAKGVAGLAPSLLAGTRGLVMLLSSAADQPSYPDEAGTRSVFSRHLVAGLEGAADADGDRALTHDEVFRYVRRRVVEWCLETGKTQTPLVLPQGGTAAVLGRVPAVPTLRVEALVDGRPRAGARIRINGSLQSSRTPAVFQLERGKTYEVEVSVPPSGNTRYEPARHTVRADTPGAQTWTASLVAIHGPRVPPGCRAVSGTGAEPYTGTGYAREVVHEGTGMELVFIPAGSFVMGSPASEERRDDDETQHRVTLSRPFYLGKYEVTQGQWQRVMGSNPSRFTGSDRLPVEKVSWEECQAFCRKTGLRLPTESEWEYACRAGTETPFETGWTIRPDQANYDGNYTYGNGPKGVYRKRTTAVGSFAANGWGLYDMHGNVYEWCADWYGAYPSGPVTDPTGPASGKSRVLRGGSWFNDPRDCRSAGRGRNAPGSRYSHRHGFRLAVDF